MNAANIVIERKITEFLYNRGIKTIFSEFLGLDISARRAALARLCDHQSVLDAEVQSLLRSTDKAKGFLSLPPIADLSIDGWDHGSWIGQSIGSYQFIRELGCGNWLGVCLGGLALSLLFSGTLISTW